MARFKIVEETFAYKEYYIEAASFDEAKRKWEENIDEVSDAANFAKWEVSDTVELHSIEDEKGNFEYW